MSITDSRSHSFDSVATDVSLSQGCHSRGPRSCFLGTDVRQVKTTYTDLRCQCPLASSTSLGGIGRLQGREYLIGRYWFRISVSKWRDVARDGKSIDRNRRQTS